MLSNKVAVVSGATRGIGKAIALELASHGADIAFNYVNSMEHAETLCGEIEAMGRKCKSYQTDITDYEAIKMMTNDVEDRFGPIDIIINNAGVNADSALVTMPIENWHKVINTNLTGTFNLTKAVIMSMMKRRAGIIINVTSIAGVYGNPRQTNYSASKAGIIGFTKALAKEVGGYGIRVNAIAPGFIETDMTTGLEDKLKNVLVGRKGTPEEIAKLICYLCSEDSGYIVGEVINISGGLVF